MGKEEKKKEDVEELLEEKEVILNREHHHRTRKRRKFWQRKRNLISLLSVIILGIFGGVLVKLNLIPLKYTIILLIILIFYQLISFLVLNSKKKGLKILGGVLVIISIIVNLVGIYYLYNTNRFLESSFNNNGVVISNTYYVVTSKSSGLKKTDIKGNVEYVNNNKKVKQAIEKLKTRYEVELIESDDITKMFANVLDNTSKFMLVESSSYNIVFDLDKNFKKDDFVVLEKINVNSKVKVESKNKGNGFNIYLGGTDFTYNTRDFNMIASVNIDNNEILLTSIPRDYYIPVYGRDDGRCDTLSYMGPYGVDVSVGSIENYFNTKIDYYLTFNANNIVDVVDTLGGISYCSDEAFDVSGVKGGSRVYINKGCQTINGKQALSIARVRKSFTGGDRARQEHIRKIMIGMLGKLKDTNTVTNYANILDSFEGLYDTTIPRDVISKLAQASINNRGNWKIKEQAVDGVDGKDFVHLTQYKDWVMYPDKATVDAASKEINRVVNE